MKRKTTLLLMMLIASAGLIHAQVLEDFETPATVDGGSWGGVEANVIKNPLATGNPSDTVWKIKKNNGAWDGSWVNFSTKQDYTAGKGLAIKVLSVRAGTAVMVKVEGGASGTKEVAAATTVAGEWETLNYDFSEIGADYGNTVFYINGGTEKDLPDSILVDDITLTDFAQSPMATLSSMTYDETDVPGMHQTIFNYDVLLASSAVIVPTVAATATHANATVVVNDAPALPGTTTVVVTAEDGVSSITYSINFTLAAGAIEPETAAPAPPARTAAEVISIFSDAYTDAPGTDFNPYWWQSTVQTFDTIEGDAFMKYASFNWQGTQFDATVNASDMEFLHVDMWTADATTVNVFCNDNDDVDPPEIPVALDPIVAGQWNSYDIPVSSYSDAGLNLSALHQFKFDGGDGNVTIFLDNLYFYRTIAAGTDASLSDLLVDGVTINAFTPTSVDYLFGLVQGTTTVPTVTYTTADAAATAVLTEAASIPGTTTIVVTSADGNVTETYSVHFKVTSPDSGAPVPPERDPARVISIFSDAYTSIDGIDWNPNWGQSTKVSTWEIVAGDTVLEYKDLNWQGTLTASPVDASAMDYLHVDMWTNNADSISLSPLSGAGEARIGMSITPATWVSYDIPVASFPAPINVAEITGFKFDSEMGEIKSADIILDNIYFYSTVKSEDATLTDLQVDGVTITDFDPLTSSYIVAVPLGTTDVPTVTASPADDKATVEISDAVSLPGTTFITVTAEEPTVTKVYSVDFELGNSVTSTDVVNFNAFVYDGMLNINMDEELVDGNLEVIDITGKRLFHSSVSSTNEQFELRFKGVLIVKVTDKENQHVVIQKVISR